MDDYTRTMTDNMVAKLTRIIIGVLMSIALSACQSTGEESNNDTQQIAMVSVAKENYTMSASANVFAWKPGGVHVVPGEKFNVDAMRTVISSSIKELMLKKGYRFGDASSNPDLQVSYLAALEEAVSDDEIVRRFGMMPGFNRPNPDTARYQKGTIVIDIMDVETGKSVWRGAVQGFAVIERSQEERQQRVNAIIGELMAQFPGKK